MTSSPGFETREDFNKLQKTFHAKHGKYDSRTTMEAQTGKSKSKALKKVGKKSAEQNKADYNDRSRSWDSKNRFYGSGVGGNTI